MNRMASLEEMVAVGLSDLPDIGLLLQVEKPNQRDYWHQLHTFYLTVALCWRFRILNPSENLESPNDRLYRFVQYKEIDKIHYELAWRRAEKLQAFYKLLEVGDKYIASAFLEQGFFYPYTPSSLFSTIVKHDADNLFKVCLEPYKHVPILNILTACKLTIKVCKLEVLKSEEVRKIKYLSKQFPSKNKLYEFAILVCTYKAQQDKKLEQLLLKYTNAITQEAEITKTAMSRTRNSETYARPRSFVWSNGEIIHASRYGGTYTVDPSRNDKENH